MHSQSTRNPLLSFCLQADIDNSGTIDYGEFLAATVHLNKLEREENLLSAFSFFDKDGSGYITIDELQQACKEFGLSELNLDEMISEIDQDNVSFFTANHHYTVACSLFQSRVFLLFAGWTDRLWRIRGHDEKRERRNREANDEKNYKLGGSTGIWGFTCREEARQLTRAN